MTANRTLVTLLWALGLAACGSDSTGPTPVQPPDVLLSGNLVIPGTYEADLDTGTLQTDGTVDIWDESISDADVQLNVENGARLALMGTDEPDYAACAAATFNDTPVELIGLPVGSHFCITTEAGRIARIRLTKAVTVADHELDIAFTTWKLPG